MYVLGEFSFEAAGVVNGMMAFSLVLLIVTISLRKQGKENKFLKYTSLVIAVANAVILVWLLCNKEAFHWNYDIATGKPVDHYSTFGRCVVMACIAAVSSTAATILHFLKGKK